MAAIDDGPSLHTARHTSCSTRGMIMTEPRSNQDNRNAPTTVGTDEHSIVAIYDSHDGAEAAIKALQQAGLDMKRLSIVGRDYHTEEHALGFYTSGDRMKFWGTRGAFWGSLWGMLFGGTTGASEMTAHPA